MDIWSSFQVIKKHKWLIIACSSLSYLLVLFLAHFITDDYVSSAKLIVTPPSRVATASAPMNQGTDWLSDPRVLVELLTGQEFLERVVKVTKVAPTWYNLLAEIKVSPLDAGENANGATTILMVQSVASDPHQSYVIADVVCNEFVRYIPEVASREFASNRRFLAALVEEAQQKLQTAEAAVKQWQEKHQALDVSSAASDYLKDLSKLEQEKSASMQQVEALQGRIDDLQRFMSGAGEVPPWLVMDQKNQHIPELQGLLSTERLKLFKLEQVLKPGEPSLEDQRRYVDKIQTILQTETKKNVESLLQERASELHDAQSKLVAVQNNIKSMRDTWALAKNNLDYNHLNRDIATWSKNYDELLAQLFQARIAEQNARREGAISILERPLPGTALQGVLVKMKKSMPLVLPLCIGLGLGVAFLIESLSKELQLRPRIEDAMDLPVLGTIARLPKSAMQQYQDIPVSRAYPGARGPEA